MGGVQVWIGQPYPLGATVTKEGVNFALFSENATGVDLCLFDHVDAPQETVRIRLTEHTDQVWHCFLPGLREGQLYGYRVYGAYDPEHGHRFNDSKLLLDPYAKAITGLVNWGPEMFGYEMGAAGDKSDLIRDYRDNAYFMPKSVVVNDAFEWGSDRPPGTPLHASVIYEAHVKGFSKLCPELPPEIRGTYAAMGSQFAVDYFKKLGITAVELLPVHHFVNDEFLLNKGLTNYWGYNSIGYFAPHSAYASNGTHGQQVTEFKQMVKNLHAAGIEVILDVVYNHTGEGNHLGPMLCFRGVDNTAYYRLVADDKRYYKDYTGTGNTLNMMHPRVLQLIMDSLRYWVLEMRVDGFRFDLAATLARELHEVSRLSAFFDIIHQDPVLSRVKLIAEPWDVGEGGYQVGNFPVLWAEWNGKYRDCVRSYWKGDEGLVAEMAYRLTGSSDLYQRDGKRPYASINFLVAHDGFTLKDSVSYNEKHNAANGENGQDGHNDNRSWNCGVEGPTDDPAICRLRRRQMRNFLATMFLSQGVPMLCGGDEYGRTQSGNNNAYCQDNEISWFTWERNEHELCLQEFTSRIIRLRHDHPVFRRPKFFQGRRIRGMDIKDIMWFSTDGSEMTDEDWNSAYVRCLGMLLSGDTMDVRDPRGEPIRDDTFLVLFNAHHEPVTFVLAGQEDVSWELLLDTQQERGFLDQPTTHTAGDELELVERSMCLLKLSKGEGEHARAPSWKKRTKPAGVPTAPPEPVETVPAADPTTAGTAKNVPGAPRIPKPAPRGPLN
jgi:glycogen operon protein